MISAPSSAASAALPHELAGVLHAIGRRMRRQKAVGGCLRAFALAAGFLLLATGIEALWPPDSRALRLALSLSVPAAAAVGAWWWVVRPLRRRHSLEAIARWVDSRHPETEERLSTAVNLSGSSGDLLAEVLREAESGAAALDPDAEVPAARLRRPAALAAAGALALLVVALVWPSPLAGVVNPLRETRIAALPPEIAAAADEAAPDIPPPDTRPDAPPEVAIDSPAKDEVDLRPDATLALAYSVSDDGSLTQVQVRIRIDGKPDIALPVDPPAPGEFAGQWRGNVRLNAAELPLENAGEFRLAVVATDDRDPAAGGPQDGASRELAVRLRRDAKSLLEQAWEAQADELRDMMRDTETTLREAEQRMRSVAGRLRGDGEIPERTVERMDEGAQLAAEAQAAVEQLAAHMEQSAFARQSQAVGEAAENHAAPAAGQAAEIPLTDDRDEKADLAENSAENLVKAIEALREQRRLLEESRREAMRVARTVELAERQDALAGESELAQAQGNDGRDPDAAREWLDEEKRVARQADELRGQVSDDGEVPRTEEMQRAVERHRQALEQGARDAARAAEAATATSDESRETDIARSAEPARESADRLMEAAEAAMESMAIPPSSRPSGMAKASKPGDSGQKPGQGKGGNAAQQPETPSGAVPAPVAVPGFSEADWAKIGGVVRGATGADGPGVPAEYRELVKQYFERLNREATANPRDNAP